MVLTHAPACDRSRTLTSRPPAPVLLAGLVAAIVALDIWWLELESRPPRWETARHLRNSLLYLHGFSLSDPTPFLTGYVVFAQNGHLSGPPTDEDWHEAEASVR